MALRRRLPSLALTAVSVGGLAWLVVAQHDQLAGPSRESGMRERG